MHISTHLHFAEPKCLYVFYILYETLMLAAVLIFIFLRTANTQMINQNVVDV